MLIDIYRNYLHFFFNAALFNLKNDLDILILKKIIIRLKGFQKIQNLTEKFPKINAKPKITLDIIACILSLNHFTTAKIFALSKNKFLSR